MQFVMLCGLVLAVAAAPYFKEQMVKKDQKGSNIRKRSAEKVMFGNHQNSPRVKKGDPFLVTKVELMKENQDSIGNDYKFLNNDTNNKEPVKVYSKGIVVKALKLTPAIKSEKASVSKESSGLKHEDKVKLLEKSLLNPDDHKSKTTNNKLTKPDSNLPVKQFGMAPATNDPRYIDLLRLRFSRARRSYLRRRRRHIKSASGRSKRDLGYTDLYNMRDDDDDDDDSEYEPTDEELEEFLAPYVRERLIQQYGKVFYNDPELDDIDDNDDVTPSKDSYYGNDINREQGDVPADNSDLADLLATYFSDRRYPDTTSDDEDYDPERRDKKTPLLSMVPGSRRKRFEYPYSLEPQGHWGGFVNTDKRESSEKVYEDLFRLAEALSRRKAYSDYLEALESYKK